MFPILLIAFSAIPASGTCNPCPVSYAVKVRYTLNNNALQTTLTGNAQVFDGVIDLNAGPVQGLLSSHVGAGATLDETLELSLNGGPSGKLLVNHDSLFAVNGPVVGWVDAPVGSAGNLHLGTFVTQAQPHPFTYALTARGTESPKVDFAYTITATGDETSRTNGHQEQKITIAHFDPNSKECRSVEGDVCLPVGCKRQSSRLDEYSSSPKIDYQFYDFGDRCSHFRIEVSSTNFWKKMCNDATNYDCSLCGAWYEGIAVLDGYCETQRSWTRTVNGTGRVEAKPPTNFTTTYAAAGGVLGSGQPDTVAQFGTPTYTAALTNCNVNGVPVSCSNLAMSMNGPTLIVSTGYTDFVSTSKNGSSSLNGTQGMTLIDSLPFSTENGDVRHFAEATFQGKVYRDHNGDGFVDVGPFSVWMAGPNDDQLWGAFDRTGFPVAFIDSIAPNPSLFGQPVQFVGHGAGPFSTYHWFTHRQDQSGGMLIGTAATFSRSDLNAGGHQIRLQVAGVNPSPFTYATLTVNQPPVAFINHVENVVDPLHASVSLLLRDGAQTDPFEFDGGGIDYDGSITTYEWTSNIEPGGVLSSGPMPQFQKSLTALGTHVIRLRVRDNAGVWSAPVTTSVTVRRPPVLLVHGFCGDSSSWDELVNNSWLGPQWVGGDVVRRMFDANGDGNANDSPADNAPLIRAEIQNMKQLFGVRTVNLLTHSMGGLSSRAYLEGPGFQNDVNKLVMIATPNHGSSIADLTLMTNGYSEEDVELYIPIQGVKALLVTLGIVVDVIDFFDPTSTIACLGQDSPALHALRPHGSFLRNLNRTYRDEGTEDFGASGQPADTLSPYAEYFVIHGTTLTFSHTHLPQWVVDAIRVSTLGQVDLSAMSLMWARKGDTTVTRESAVFDGAPAEGFDHGHMKLRTKEDSVKKGLFYLLDDPPPPPPADVPLSSILAAHPLGAGRGRFGSTRPLDPPATLEVDAAATRLRVGVSLSTLEPIRRGSQAQTTRMSAPIPMLLLTSPSGVRYESSSPREGFTVSATAGNIEAVVEKPEPGTWQLQIVQQSMPNARNARTPLSRESRDAAIPRTAVPEAAIPPTPIRQPGGRRVAIPTPRTLPVEQPLVDYSWLAVEESGTFIALGLSAERVAPGEPVKIAAYVQTGESGVAGATVNAAVSNGREKESVKLTENTAFAGLYTGEYTPKARGIYRVLAAAEAPAQNAKVTRVAFATFEARLLPDLIISLSSSVPTPRHGENVRLTARVQNRGKAPVTAIPVRFFDGPPAKGGKFLDARNVIVPAGGSTLAWIPWTATAGAHTLMAIVDPENVSGEDDTKDNVATLGLRVVDRVPPIARAGIDQVATLGKIVVFDGRASTDDDRIVSYNWTLVPATAATATASAAESITRRGAPFGVALKDSYAALVGGFPAPGTYVIRLTVTDASGNTASDDLLVRVVQTFDTVPAIANAGPDITTGIGRAVQFDGTGSRDNHGIVRATWDIDLARDSDGDGNPRNDKDLVGLSPTLSRGYPRAGTFRVVLTVSDAVGNAPSTDEMLVTIPMIATRPDVVLH